MRIVAGAHKGRILESPDGRDTRPTSDRTRESLFNILQHAKWLESQPVEDALVLDAFAGTGALGLEALSRGGAHAVFMEKDRAAAALCRRNMEKLGEEARGLVLACDALKPPARQAVVAPRTLVFLDPPYGKGWGADALAALAEKGWLAPGAFVVMEMAKKSPEETPAGFTLCDERDWGVARVRFLRGP